MAAAESSFDVVSKVDMQEVRNAIQQAVKEIHTRFDFKGSKTQIELVDNEMVITSAEDIKLKNGVDVLQTKLHKRGVPLKALQPGKIEEALGGTVRQKIQFQSGIPIEKAREIVKMVKGTKLKVQASIQGDQVRISGKKKDDLQEVITLLKETDLGIHMQFVNYR
jgi:uncharacterized protein YajQ (UPF0234 family)